MLTVLDLETKHNIIYLIKYMKAKGRQNLQFKLRRLLKSAHEKNTFGFLQTLLLCIVGEIAGGGSMALAVDASDM